MGNFQEYTNKNNNDNNKNNFKKRIESNKTILNNLYNEKVIDRGYYYYLNRNIIYNVRYDNYLYGVVAGGQKYKVKVDLKNLTGQCTCGYKNNCKHAYALILSYFNDTYIDGEKLLNSLDKLPKEEILIHLKNIIVDNYLWVDYFDKKVKTDKSKVHNNVEYGNGIKNELELAKNMLKLLNLEKKNIFTFKSYLSNEFLNNATDEQIMEFIQYFLKSKYYYDIEDSYYEEILHKLISELFKRSNEDVIHKLLNLSKSNNDLWMVNDYIIDNEYYDLLD
ncbi:SWIM zinc finger family protein [Methanococcus voltae]|uniref:Zinc finger SWIM domain protein n=1 Tax=Methanococcus voltae (strain ATCC BAA-1334 / A3) TaxID=456320 RepID=D7DUT2_METV3|nr:SWIM zinc finger family protein [Methanococcus voltae]MCS3900694.1 hypothetical protein [Methanococcus voltae]